MEFYKLYNIRAENNQILEKFVHTDGSKCLADDFKPVDFLLTFEFRTARLSAVCCHPEAVFTATMGNIEEKMAFYELGVTTINTKNNYNNRKKNYTTYNKQKKLIIAG